LKAESRGADRSQEEQQHGGRNLMPPRDLSGSPWTGSSAARVQRSYSPASSRSPWALWPSYAPEVGRHAEGPLSTAGLGRWARDEQGAFEP
jgi:hypothetical protein